MRWKISITPIPAMVFSHAISCVNIELVSEVSEMRAVTKTPDTDVIFTWLITWEDFTAYSHHENFKLYTQTQVFNN
jgi:hypothetical protein